MHEAALATAIACRLNGGGSYPAAVRMRLIVRGGHHDPAAFDAALRLHLAMAVPACDTAQLEIVHEAAQRWCAACRTTFRSSDPLAPCPACGGAALPSNSAEEIDLEWVSADPAATDAARSDPGGPVPAGPSGPRFGDRQPSSPRRAKRTIGSRKGG